MESIPLPLDPNMEVVSIDTSNGYIFGMVPFHTARAHCGRASYCYKCVCACASVRMPVPCTRSAVLGDATPQTPPTAH